VGNLIAEIVHEILIGPSNEDGRTVGLGKCMRYGLDICGNHARNLKSNTWNKICAFFVTVLSVGKIL